MSKIQIEHKSPMLSLAMSSSPKAKPQDMKDVDAGSKVSKKAEKDREKQQPPKPKDLGMTSGSVPAWKPPGKKEMAHDTVHSAIRESMRKWVTGEISTKQHNENIKRGKSALETIPKIREGRY